MDIIFPNFAVRNYLRYSKAVFKPKPGTKSEVDIYSNLIAGLAKMGPFRFGLLTKLLFKIISPERIYGLAIRLGPHGAGVNPFSKKFFKKLTMRRLKKSQSGVDLGRHRVCLPDRLFTDDKKIHLDQPLILPELQRLLKEYPAGKSAGKPHSHNGDFTLISRRELRSNNSWMHNFPRLQSGKNICTLYIHPDDAARLGIASGEKIKVTSRVSTVEIEAEVTDAILPGVVCMPHGYGHDRPDTKIHHAQTNNVGASINDLTDETLRDELAGTAALNSTTVTISRTKKHV